MRCWEQRAPSLRLKQPGETLVSGEPEHPAAGRSDSDPQCRLGKAANSNPDCQRPWPRLLLSAVESQNPAHDPKAAESPPRVSERSGRPAHNQNSTPGLPRAVAANALALDHLL